LSQPAAPANEATHRRTIGQALLGIVLTAAFLFGTAGTWRWWNGWAYLGIFVVVGVTLTATVYRKSPDLVLERKTAGKKAKAWDRVLAPVVGRLLPFATLLLAALDRRFAWTYSVSAAASLLAFAVVVGASVLTFWAMASNRFFSSYVRIQADRGHGVVAHGPYAWVRHPGYTGAIVFGLASPILLGSLVAFWVGVATVPLWIARTILEDRTLQDELSGYREYAAKVRYRLIPSVW
jgi:protein-S-isoprenylcysteine O-methyltransferase Ste14